MYLPGDSCFIVITISTVKYGVATLVGGACGSNADNPANVQHVIVGSSTKGIQGHLRTYAVVRLWIETDTRSSR